LKTAGHSFLSGSEVGRPLDGGTFVDVAPTVASTISLGGGSGAIGVARPITVVARDVFGNIATSYNGALHVTSSDPAAVLPSDVAAVNGVATFNVTLLTV